MILFSREKRELLDEVFGKITRLYIVAEGGAYVRLNGCDSSF